MMFLPNPTTIMTTLAGLGFLGQFTFLIQIPVILAKIFGFSTFKVRNDNERVKAVIKILDKETYSSLSIFEYGKEHPAGVFIGWNCFGYYTDNPRDSDVSTEITIFTSKSNFKRILDNSVVPCESIMINNRPGGAPIKQCSPVTIWNRNGCYTHMYYSDFKIDLSNIVPLGDQRMVMDDIIDKYKESKRVTAFVQGVTGSGKSTLGLLIAKELKGSYCHDFNPSEPGDSFKGFLRDSRGDADISCPIVIVMEEIDTLIKNIHEGSVQRHKNVTTSVHNKASFNTFLDDMVFHKNVILILTSNKKKEDIDTLDLSYLREGRINAYYDMCRQIVA